MAKAQVVTLSPFNQFLLVYGIFLASWHSFEVMVEVLIRRELRLSVEETCIVTAGLGFGAKFAILRGLLNRTDAGRVGTTLIAQAQQIAERNSFAHSFLSVDATKQHFTQTRREVKDTLTVRLKRYSVETMEKQKDDFFAKFAEAQKHFGITDADLDAYTREIESFAKAPEAPASPLPESPASSHSPRQQRRAEQRAQNPKNHRKR